MRSTIFYLEGNEMRFCGIALALILSVGMHVSAALGADADLSVGEHDIDLGDVRLHYVVRGQGPLLLVTSPGWGIGSNYLQSSLTPLEKKLKVVYIDTRASGGSSRPADSSQMSQAVMADDIDKLRGRLGLERIDLLGHSDGGTIAIEYGVRHPQHVGKLLLIAPAVLGDRESEFTNAILNLWSTDPRYQDAVREERHANWGGPNFTDEEFATGLVKALPLYFADPSRHVATFMKSHLTGRPSAYAYRTWGEAAEKSERNQTKDLGFIQARTLIINGTVDWICPYPAAQRLHAAIPNSELRLYANRGHFTWIEDAPRFFDEVLGFLAN